jgi:hypothetical protein
MHALFLPGNSARNKAWIETLASELAPCFSSKHIHYYKHWSTGDELIDFDYEASVVAEYIERHQVDAVIAKSAGTALTMRLIDLGKLRTQPVLLMGIALEVAKNYKVDYCSTISKYPGSVTVLQNELDPFASGEQVRVALAGTSALVHIFPGNATHGYGEYAVIRRMVVGE